MIMLVLTVCLAASPSDCRREAMTTEGSLLACISQGQLAAATWVSAHPRWVLRRWSCGPAGEET